MMQSCVGRQKQGKNMGKQAKEMGRREEASEQVKQVNESMEGVLSFEVPGKDGCQRRGAACEKFN
jgi:hypothetical protein